MIPNYLKSIAMNPIVEKKNNIDMIIHLPNSYLSKGEIESLKREFQTVVPDSKENLVIVDGKTAKLPLSGDNFILYNENPIDVKIQNKQVYFTDGKIVKS